jgi:hypothetical protein
MTFASEIKINLNEVIKKDFIHNSIF